jgi:hypothetical protein
MPRGEERGRVAGSSRGSCWPEVARTCQSTPEFREGSCRPLSCEQSENLQISKSTLKILKQRILVRDDPPGSLTFLSRQRLTTTAADSGRPAWLPPVPKVPVLILVLVWEKASEVGERAVQTSLTQPIQ